MFCPCAFFLCNLWQLRRFVHYLGFIFIDSRSLVCLLFFIHFLLLWLIVVLSSLIGVIWIDVDFFPLLVLLFFLVVWVLRFFPGICFCASFVGLVVWVSGWLFFFVATLRSLGSICCHSSPGAIIVSSPNLGTVNTSEDSFGCTVSTFKYK
ncbi:CMF_collapsed_G0013530.mRNA.1.CDS.1 [Saccharomyces cerevisiae]|nr:CMF_collapsed_G0013530.mRNA.1.CDS.1 [Saccharomyces cerevisiae]